MKNFQMDTVRYSIQYRNIILLNKR